MNKKNDKPYSQGRAITPHDSTNLSEATRAVYVGGAGNIRAIMGGVEVNFIAVPVGTVLRISATRINATGTTATNLVALN